MQLTRDQARRIDASAAAELGLPGLVLMENAGRSAADEMRKRHGGAGTAYAIFCGTGNNGGDGAVVARHLANAGARVALWQVGAPTAGAADAATNLDVAARMGLRVGRIDDAAAAQAAVATLRGTEVVVDALLGTGARGAPREPIATLIRALLRAPARARVALDLPSGLDADTGTPHAPTFVADLTLTFVAAKAGFAAAGAAAFTGTVVVCDIGVPPALVARIAAEP